VRWLSVTRSRWCWSHRSLQIVNDGACTRTRGQTVNAARSSRSVSPRRQRGGASVSVVRSRCGAESSHPHTHHRPRPDGDYYHRPSGRPSRFPRLPRPSALTSRAITSSAAAPRIALTELP